MTQGKETMKQGEAVLESTEAVSKTKKKNKEDKLGFGKLLIWQSRAVSKSIAVLILAYLMIYCTDTLKIAPALVSTILVVSKVLDGVTDLMAGFIVDRTKTKLGKGRPYEVFILGLWLATWLLFSCPESFSTAAKCIWIFAMYALTNSIAMTFLNANETVYVCRAFRQGQIVKLTSYGSIITMLASVIFNILFPTLMGNLATSASGWSRLIGMIAIPMAAIGILRFLFVPEKYDVDVAVQSGKDDLKLKDVGAVLKHNKYILIIALMTFIFNFVCNMGVNVYYFTYIVGDVSKMSAINAIQMVAIPLALVFPALIKKFSTVRLMEVGFIISAIGYGINMFAGSNMALLMIAAVLFGAGTIPASMLVSLVIIECADYNEWQGRPRMEGTMGSINNLGSKIGAALGTALLGFLLSAVGYTGDAATMPDAALGMIRALYGIVPCILYFLTALSLHFYKLNKLAPQIQKDIKARREAAKTQAADSDKEVQ